MRITMAVLVTAILGLYLAGQRSGNRADADEASAKPVTFEDVVAGKVKLLDLTYPLNEANPYWPGTNYEPFKLRTINTLEKNGVLSKAFSMPEHAGTHLDAPSHFGAGQISVDKIPPLDLFAPGVMIDAVGPASADPDYRLSVSDIQAWEKTHGRIPDGAVVLLNTGWGRHWNNVPRYQNRDVREVMHFPGYSIEAAKFLVEDANVRGVGIDTLSIDYGPSRDFGVHHVINRAKRYGLENVAHLDELPARGFYLVMAPIKIETGSGGPTRIFAVLP